MNPDQLTSTLERLIGHLVLDTDAQQRQLRALAGSLAETDFEVEASQLKGSSFSIERSDLFFGERITGSRRDLLTRITEQKSNREEESRYRMFVREVPVKEALLPNSTPTWAVGAKAEQSFGPFRNQDGRLFWFDFYLIEKMVTLYLQGQSEPALLFSTLQKGPIFINPSLNPQQNYRLTAGSIWIHAPLLASGAPNGTYVGLSIGGGRVEISSLPVVVNDKLTIPANASVQVSLNLNQPEITDADESSPYGIDARNMDLRLPGTWAFEITGPNSNTQQLGDGGWNLYGQSMRFSWEGQQAVYDGPMQRILFPMETSEAQIEIREQASNYQSLSGSGTIIRSGWALPIASIDINQPSPAAGTGSLFAQTGPGIQTSWQGQQGEIALAAPAFLISPGQILLADLGSSGPHAQQTLDLWDDGSSPEGSQVVLTFPDANAIFYLSSANGNELLATYANAFFDVDRPVQVNGLPPSVRSLRSLLIIALSSSFKLIYLYDDNLIQDKGQLSGQDPIPVSQIAFALTNALFKTTEVNGCLLFGTLSDDYKGIPSGFLFLTFGLLAYIPTLPDPYAAYLERILKQIRGSVRIDPDTGAVITTSLSVSAWLVCRVRWNPSELENQDHEVQVSFHFAPLSNQFAGISLNGDEEEPEEEQPGFSASSSIEFKPSLAGLDQGISAALTAADDPEAAVVTTPSFETAASRPTAAARDQEDLPNYEEHWRKETSRYLRYHFALLDVSTKADLYGISFNASGRLDSAGTTHVAIQGPGSNFPLQVEGMDVVSAGQHVKAFTVPQVSWEPVLNLSAPQAGVTGDPPVGPNYYPDDGGPTQIQNNSRDTVALAPIPNNQFLDEQMSREDFIADSFFTLPFGMKAWAQLRQTYDPNGELERRGGILSLESEDFPEDLAGATQIRLTGGRATVKVVSDMFAGRTVQLANVLNLAGQPFAAPKSTLGQDVTEIFNGEFSPFTTPGALQRGVPLERIDLSGYGASTFSNWLNPNAVIAQTSQARFDIFNGRCSHEVIQVKSLMYPWGIRVVRTITLFRVGSGYVYRFDTGWQAESDGRYDFSYFVNILGQDDPEPAFADFNIHPGIIKGLSNVKDIQGTDEIDTFNGSVVPEYLIDESTDIASKNNTNTSKVVKLRPVYFTADVEVENPVSGFTEQKIPIFNDQGEQTGEETRLVVPSKKVLGFVQIAPKGVPITSVVLKQLVAKHGTIGGPIDCEIDLNGSQQKMRLSRFDFNNSFGENGVKLKFAVAGRGNVLLPKDGSWTMIMHERDTGDVSPVPTNLSIPVIREGYLQINGTLNKPPANQLLRLADPADLLRQPTSDTINYGLLQNTDTQKALFLTPAFQQGQQRLFSRTPPLFADAFRIVNSKGIFPNIGDAENSFGDVISLIQNTNVIKEFNKGSLQDLGKDVWELMDISDTVEGAKQQGYQLLKQLGSGEFFDLPDTFELINLGEGNFRIYIEYARKSKDGSNVESPGGLDFNIDSLAADIADSWKSKMENIGLVVDLAGINRLMTIRGNWDSKKGAEASYPQPELVFADELQPVIDILEILQQLQGGEYADAVANGLKLAMSNKAGSWEYKFEASKEIPVLRFPVPDAVYNDPNTPFKLEAGLKIGAYFNAALEVSTSGGELKPSAGGLLGFYGRISVMCVSLSAATVYAIGEVGVDIAADTKLGPSLHMQFGFGAQVVIGLPVAGNVSVLFVVGIEMFVATGILEVTAYLLFQGHAEILGGIVSITITIEAKGTISKTPDRTNMIAQVTFGLDISIFLVINISFSTSWQEQRQIA